MKHTTAMAEINGGDQLLEIASSNFFSQLSFFNFRKQFSTFDKLQSEIHLRFTRHHFV
ncbi:hypothetical protein HanRHA438_Chr10g0473381 [Helianthus annuus]|nr:hypothetical protein HanIR_Chr10g0496671 [Helianthus annuus]KAJ0881354.1 hypothetical protein HanRHA438_Chr10g0473381 [Helianthus annuus]